MTKNQASADLTVCLVSAQKGLSIKTKHSVFAGGSEAKPTNPPGINTQSHFTCCSTPEAFTGRR